MKEWAKRNRRVSQIRGVDADGKFAAYTTNLESSTSHRLNQMTRPTKTATLAAMVLVLRVANVPAIPEEVMWRRKNQSRRQMGVRETVAQGRFDLRLLCADHQTLALKQSAP